jgi:hypothetical protein
VVARPAPRTDERRALSSIARASSKLLACLGAFNVLVVLVVINILVFVKVFTGLEES